MGCDWDGIDCRSCTPVLLSPPHVLRVTGDCPPVLHKIHRRVSHASSLILAHSLPPGITEGPPGDCAGPPGLRRDPALWPAALLHL